jgi:N-acetylglucosaminyldiphosphoundecaprenol N-acetyl-beta-D-mannosaminyltransferase
MTEIILGYEVRNDGLSATVGDILDGLASSRKLWLACLNPHSYAVAKKRDSFRAALLAADILVPDGTGIVKASRYMGGSIQERVTGSAVFYALNDSMQERGGLSVFFLGSSDDNLGDIVKNMGRDWPGVRVAGVYSPPFKVQFSEEGNAEMIRRINDAKPDVLWVGMTAPKQEEWIHANLDRLDVKFASAIGAVFDFYTGRVHRPHPVFQRLGLEWLPRLLHEPRRLWRRMFVSAPVFIWDVGREERRKKKEERRRKDVGRRT